jgi:hypothetical protein
MNKIESGSKEAILFLAECWEGWLSLGLLGILTAKILRYRMKTRKKKSKTLF